MSNSGQQLKQGADAQDVEEIEENVGVSAQPRQQQIISNDK